MDQHRFYVFAIQQYNSSGEERDVGAFGWLLPNQDYLMTTNKVVIEAQYYPTLRLTSTDTCPCVLKEKEYQLVCCSDKDSDLDYAVIKLNTSRIRSYYGRKASLSNSSRCPSLATRLNVYDDNPCVSDFHEVMPFPEGLINWAKSRSMPCSRDDIQELTLDSDGGFDWDILERGKDSLVFHSASTRLAKCGVPVCCSLGEVVAFGLFNITTRGRVNELPLVSFSYRMDKIVEDIRRQDPELAEDIQN